MSDSKSNIRIKSNVFLRSPESLSDGDHPEKDAAFAAQILDGAALMKLKKRADENGVEIAFTDIQKRILNGERNIRAAEQFIQIAESASKEILSVQMAEELAQTADGDAGAEFLAESDEGSEILSVQMTEELVQTAETADSTEFLAVQMVDAPDQTAESGEAAESLPSKTAEEPERVAESAPSERLSMEMSEGSEQIAESAKAAEISSEQTAEASENTMESAAADNIPAASAPEKPVLEKIDFNELIGRGFGDEKTLIVCADGGYAEYVSFLLYKSNIQHKLLNEISAQAPIRLFADVLWDCHDKVINRDNFVKRFTARCGSVAARADECFEAFCGFAGSAPSDGLDIGALAKSIVEGRVPDSLFGERHDNVVVAAADDVKDGQFGRAYIFENGADSTLIERDFAAENLLLSIAGCPAVVSGAGSFAALDSAGNAAVGIGKNDVNCVSFIGGNVGDAVRKQAYISHNVKCGDEIRLELNSGVYDIVHSGMVIAKTAEGFSERVLSEFGGKKYFDQLPKSLGGLMVTNIITVVSCRSAEEFGETVSPQFRDRNFWLGVEISGFAAKL